MLANCSAQYGEPLRVRSATETSECWLDNAVFAPGAYLLPDKLEAWAVRPGQEGDA
jgi:hypothetical protein